MSYTFSSRRVPVTFETLLTGAEARTALEREFLHAEHEIRAAFPAFDPAAPLASPQGRAVGESWFDLIAHTLARGVRIHITLGDGDPLARAALHEGAWRAMRLLAGAGEAAGAPGLLRVVPALHPGEAGLLARLLLWPLALARGIAAARRLNRHPPSGRDAALRDMPGLRAPLVARKDGSRRARLWPPPRLHPAMHHHKLAVFDRARLYLGGPDPSAGGALTAAMVQDIGLLVDGPAAAEAQAHLETFGDITAGRRPPGPGMRHIFRTLSRRRPRNLVHRGPEPLVQEIAIAHEHYARRARHLIYLEAPTFTDARFARHLARLAAANPDLGMILILPGPTGAGRGHGGFLQGRALRILRRAFHARIFIAGAPRPREDGRDDPACGRISIFDDVAAILAPAGGSGSGRNWDSEAGLLIPQPARVRLLARRVMARWLPEDAGPDLYDPPRAVSAWRAVAAGNALRPAMERRSLMLPYDARATVST